MLLNIPSFLVLASVAVSVAGYPGGDGPVIDIIHGDDVDRLAAKGLQNLRNWERTHKPKPGKCSLATASIRREWGALSLKERKSYTDAVLCLTKKPPKTLLSAVPGVRARYDDFMVAHANQTLKIHATGNFLGWHRNFVWLYEKALREECGYKGYQPYWNWGKYALDPVNSPLFDGSPYSLSGDGSYLNHTPVVVTGAPAPYDVILPGNGGGCITSGPFKDLKANIGPFAPSIDGVPPNPQADGWGYNPRCLRRDISENSAVSTRTNATYNLITQHTDFYWFATYMQGVFPQGILGVHGGGHFTIGGDPGGDFFISNGDPAFYLHHAQIDRVWWIWQMQDIAKRQNAMVGVVNIDGSGPNSTLEDPQYYAATGPTVKLKTLMNTLDENFCYVYV